MRFDAATAPTMRKHDLPISGSCVNLNFRNNPPITKQSHTHTNIAKDSSLHNRAIAGETPHQNRRDVAKFVGDFKVWHLEHTEHVHKGVLPLQAV
jgi:hypothetical protein